MKKFRNFYLIRKGKIWLLVELEGENPKWFLVIKRIHIILFVITFITTTVAGAILSGANPLSGEIVKGFWFSIPLLFIISCHELGHIIAMRREGLLSSFPYFLPAPNIVGTFGAIMVMISKPESARKVIKVGFAGPLMSFLVSFPFAVAGLLMSKVVEPEIAKEFEKTFSVILGSPLIFELIQKVLLDVHGDKVIVLHPLAFSGWVGFFITALNLIPIGQTDGGHIVGGIIGKTHRYFSFLLSIFFVVLGLVYWIGWIVWGILTFIFTVLTHPKYFEMKRDITKNEIFIFIFAVLIFVLTFTPDPIKIVIGERFINFSFAQTLAELLEKLKEIFF